MVLAALTVKLRAGDVLAMRLASPLYAAVMEWLPTAGDEMLRVATLLLTAALPSTTEPSLKVTVPVAMPPLAPVTVAVRVTACPVYAGFADELSAVELPAMPTVSVTAAEELVLKVLSPLYTAVSEWLPTARAEVVNVAVPPVRSADPTTAEPSLNVTDPLGVPLEPVTLAVRVTGWA
jgi:hypothetical protein